MTVDVQKDPALQGVRILKFIDQSRWVSSAQGCPQGGSGFRCLIAIQGLPGVQQDVVVRNDPLFLFAFVEILASDLNHFALKSTERQLAMEPEVFAAFDQDLGRIEETMRWRLAATPCPVFEDGEG